ncbi:dihydrofolate reductase family protein [Actinoallomurus soli]|uniref:dihydrofolate reductase family protein n=1 Tax=Actinoallomurus soli TaxID=2952535 RepID=UPI0027E2DB53|nr:dihydrofolate reductase family protein [Actinoallomurus soli]
MDHPRPYVVLSVATSVDGHIDDTGPDRLVLSNEADFDRVDQVRAESDAILIGATTLRRDNPRLLVNSARRRDERAARGLPPYPLKVTVTRSGDLDRDLRFWHHGGDKLVYCPDPAVPKLRERLGDLADVAGLGPDLDFGVMLDDLGRRGIGRLMVEGGGTIHTQFLTAGLADEIHLAIAPFFLGDPDAPRFVNAGRFPYGPGNRMTLAEARTIGDIAFLRYLPEGRAVSLSPAPPSRSEDRRWLSLAIDLAEQCPPSDTAFSVGCVIVDADGSEISRGFSRERPHFHAEESALSKVAPDDERLPGATLYSSLEPCTRRSSRPRPCAELILDSPIRRVVVAWREPPVFVADAHGVQALEAAGITVVEIPELADAASRMNAHILGL